MSLETRALLPARLPVQFFLPLERGQPGNCRDRRQKLNHVKKLKLLEDNQPHLEEPFERLA